MSELKCPNCGSTSGTYSIPDWEHDSERGNFCTNPGWYECHDCGFHTGSKNTEAEIMAALTRPTSQEAERLVDELIEVATSWKGDFKKEAPALIESARSRLLSLCAGRDLVEWQPIGTAPKDGTIFLAITSYGLQCTMRFNGECFVRNVTCRRCDGMGLGDLTHWMPIPALPKEDR